VEIGFQVADAALELGVRLDAVRRLLAPLEKPLGFLGIGPQIGTVDFFVQLAQALALRGYVKENSEPFRCARAGP